MARKESYKSKDGSKGLHLVSVYVMWWYRTERMCDDNEYESQSNIMMSWLVMRRWRGANDVSFLDVSKETQRTVSKKKVLWRACRLVLGVSGS